MTRPTTITLSFLLVLLVIAGMNLKNSIEAFDRLDRLSIIADSLLKHPELIDRYKYYDSIPTTNNGSYTNRLTLDGEDTIPNDFPNHSEIKR